MSEPQTVNVGLIVANTGDLVNTWGSAALNPDFVAIDGYAGGVQTISVSNTNVLLTSPSSFTPTPSAGPTQAQNAVLKFTGTLTANVQVTLPLPGFYIIDNQTTGAFVLSFRAIGSGQVIGLDQGEVQHIYNDGTNVRFCNLGRVGAIEIWAGLTAIPAWVSACTVLPYLLCNGSGYSTTTYPNLFNKLGYAFGGAGSTFNVPDLRGRVPLPYDNFGRITTGGCGLNGATIGAALDAQTITLVPTQIPNLSAVGNNTLTSDPTNVVQGTLVGGSSGAGETGIQNGTGRSSSITVSGLVTVNTSNTGGAAHGNVQPSQVTGIAVIRAA